MIEQTEQSQDMEVGKEKVEGKRLQIPVGTKLEVFKNGREHFLAYAIQNQTKIPTLNSIRRTERRQQQKKLQRTDRNNQARPSRRINNISNRSEALKFALPNKYGRPTRLKRTKYLNKRRSKRVPQSNLNIPPRVPNFPPFLPQMISPFRVTGIPPPLMLGSILNAPIGMSVPSNHPIEMGLFRPSPPPRPFRSDNNPPTTLSDSLSRPPRPTTQQVTDSRTESPFSVDKSTAKPIVESRQQDSNVCLNNPSSPVLPHGFGLGSLLPCQVVKVDLLPLGVIEPPAIKSKHVHPVYTKSISLPQQLSLKPKPQRTTKNMKKAFKVKSPEQLLLKSQRAQIIKQLETQTQKIGQQERSINPKRKEQNQRQGQQEKSNKLKREVQNQEIPDYFRKKKASQQRRRKEKHELIKSNRSQLVSIFGDAIFKSGWPVSRKEIKLALGIREEESEVDLQEFAKLTESEETNCKVQTSFRDSLE